MSELKESLHPIYYAAKLHEKIVTIYPFSDGKMTELKGLL
jgi:Fic family protein